MRVQIVQSNLKRLTRVLGSLAIAVVLLVAIAVVLAWGTIYESRVGPAAVQRFVYHAGWFQALLGFLALNLTIAALQRYPWRRRQAPFLLAHAGIILILVGGILGSWFGIEGQLTIPEGQAEHTLELPGNVLVVRQATSGSQRIIPTRFETQVWVHEPNLTMPVTLDGRTIQLTVDRYYPDAVADEEITNDALEENPAVQMRLAHHEERQDVVWLLSRDPERFGVGWKEAHILFLEPRTDEQLQQLLGQASALVHPRGMVSVRLPGMSQPQDIPVPETLNRTRRIEGTVYSITFLAYFPDFAMVEAGPISQSESPQNPAVSFTLSGPEGSDAYLLFAFHPEFQTMHSFPHTIAATVSYAFDTAHAIPSQGIALIRDRVGGLIAVSTGHGAERAVINPVVVGTRYTHPFLGYQFEVAAFYPRATVAHQITNRSDAVKGEALHLVAQEAGETAEAWVGLHGTAHLALGQEPLVVEYRPGQRQLPFTIKLLDFRKIDYPGTQMAANFESDVELTDPQRGLILLRTISMNNPLRYRGYSFFQSSYIDGSVETTILAARNDFGTPVVYAGFFIVMGGVIWLFFVRTNPRRSTHGAAR